MSEIKIELPEGYELKKVGEAYKVVKKEFELEVGRDYRHVAGSTLVIDREWHAGNYGFLNNEFTESLWCSNPEEWIEATKEEVIEAFEEECVRRLGENWKDVEIEESVREGCSRKLYQPMIYKDINGWEVWNNHGCLYYKGKWAKKKVKYAEKLEDIERAYYISSSGEINRSISFQDVNNLPTEKLAEGVLALIQLLSFRQDIWDKGGKPEGDVKYGIYYIESKNELKVNQTYSYGIFVFKTKEQAEYFLDKHKDLIIEYLKNLK